MAEDGGAAVDVVAVASVQEEIGHHGARAAAFALEPDVAIAVDVTYATDVPGERPEAAGKVELGSGAAITRGPVVNRGVSDLLVDGGRGGRDPARVRGAVRGARTPTPTTSTCRAAASRPGSSRSRVRYMHSPCEIASLDDLEAVDPARRRVRRAG